MNIGIFMWDNPNNDLNFKELKIDWYFLCFFTLSWKDSQKQNSFVEI